MCLIVSAIVGCWSELSAGLFVFVIIIERLNFVALWAHSLASGMVFMSYFILYIVCSKHFVQYQVSFVTPLTDYFGATVLQ